VLRGKNQRPVHLHQYCEHNFNNPQINKLAKKQTDMFFLGITRIIKTTPYK